MNQVTGFWKYREILMKFHIVPINYNASPYAFVPNLVDSRETWIRLYYFHIMSQSVQNIVYKVCVSGGGTSMALRFLTLVKIMLLPEKMLSVQERISERKGCILYHWTWHSSVFRCFGQFPAFFEKFNYEALTDERRGHKRRTPIWVQFSFFIYFSEKIGQIIGWRPPPSAWEILDPPLWALLKTESILRSFYYNEKWG